MSETVHEQARGDYVAAAHGWLEAQKAFKQAGGSTTLDEFGALVVDEEGVPADVVAEYHDARLAELRARRDLHSKETRLIYGLPEDATDDEVQAAYEAQEAGE